WRKQRRHMAGEYINSKAGKKRIKKQWKNREKKDELHTFKDTTLREMHTTSRYASRTSASIGEGHSFIALRFRTCISSQLEKGVTPMV
ncbi:hypothetical protein, partial [Prevotella intermedia]|uniref:hypothetical protein n=1 Tax=Prevotella intermedia TaxID=28131 RepID=UPI001C540FDC